MCHDCSGGDYGVGSDVHAGQDRGGCSDPHVPSDGDRLRGDVRPPLVGFNRMTGRDQVDLRCDHDLVRDVDGSVAFEHAMVTDEDGLADGDVQPVIRVEGRDEREGVANGLADQLLESRPNRLRFILAVFAELGGESGGHLDPLEQLPELRRLGSDQLTVVHPDFLTQVPPGPPLAGTGRRT